jgi:hypothetical protein
MEKPHENKKGGLELESKRWTGTGIKKVELLHDVAIL